MGAPELFIPLGDTGLITEDLPCRPCYAELHQRVSDDGGVPECMFRYGTTGLLGRAP